MSGLPAASSEPLVQNSIASLSIPLCRGELLASLRNQRIAASSLCRGEYSSVFLAYSGTLRFALKPTKYQHFSKWAIQWSGKNAQDCSQKHILRVASFAWCNSTSRDELEFSKLRGTNWHFLISHFSVFHLHVIVDCCWFRPPPIDLILPSREAKKAYKTNIKSMIPKNSKFNACNPWSKSLHITSNLDQDHEGCRMSHAKSHTPKVPIKQTVFWNKRLADWWEFEPTDSSKSPSSTSSKCHMADSRIASFTKMHFFLNVFLLLFLRSKYCIALMWRILSMTCKNH